MASETPCLRNPSRHSWTCTTDPAGRAPKKSRIMLYTSLFCSAPRWVTSGCSTRLTRLSSSSRAASLMSASSIAGLYRRRARARERRRIPSRLRVVTANPWLPSRRISKYRSVINWTLEGENRGWTDLISARYASSVGRS